MKRLCVLAGICATMVGALGTVSLPAWADSAVTVNSNLIEQKVAGFGGSDAWQAGAIHSYPVALQNQILNLLFSRTSGAGLSMLRHRIPPTIEPSEGTFDWTTDNDAIWLTQEAIKRGVRTVWSTPWTPPAWMKTNDSLDNGGSLEPAYYSAYAQYLADYIQQYKSLGGVTIDGISLQNEPDENVSYESCLWTGQQFHDFIAGALIPTFKADGITTKVIMPENSLWSDSLAGPTLADPATAAAVSVIASHDYDFGMYPFTDALNAGKQVWETEVANLGTNDPSIVDGLNWAISIHNAFVVGRVSAWHYWWLFSVENGTGQSLIDGNAGLTSFTVNKRLWTIGNFARFVRPGSNLIGLISNTPEPGVYTSAFRDVGTGELVVVAVNDNANSTNLTVNLPAFAISSLTPHETSATYNLKQQASIPVVNGTFTATLDPQSVTTFVGAGKVSNPAAPVRIACGSNGSAPFLGDFDYNLGNTYGVTTPIDTSGVSDPAPQSVYQNQRWYPGTFTYTIPGLAGGKKYTVRLHFAETYWTAANQRLFNVAINGSPVLTNFDVFATAGAANKAVVESFNVRAMANGKLSIAFSPGSADNPMISGIEVLAPSS